jgi:hypothetical protein
MACATYDANSNKVATVNAVGNVFVDTFDANGNQLTHKSCACLRRRERYLCEWLRQRSGGRY